MNKKIKTMLRFKLETKKVELHGQRINSATKEIVMEVYVKHVRTTQLPVVIMENAVKVNVIMASVEEY